MLHPNLPTIDDKESDWIPSEFKVVIDAHAHVQCFDIDSRDTDSIFDVCQSKNKPVVIHIGKEPKSQSYRCDPLKICGVAKTICVLR